MTGKALPGLLTVVLLAFHAPTRAEAEVQQWQERPAARHAGRGIVRVQPFQIRDAIQQVLHNRPGAHVDGGTFSQLHRHLCLPARGPA